jgi:hypothetical protein
MPLVIADDVVSAGFFREGEELRISDVTSKDVRKR